MSTQLIAAVSSDGTVSPGQKHRSSDDFSFTVPHGAIELEWQVTSSPNTSSVTFDVRQDLSLGGDPPRAKGCKSGSTSTTSQFPAGGNFYIASPSNNPGNPPPRFTVQLYAVFP